MFILTIPHNHSDLMSNNLNVETFLQAAKSAF